MNLQIAERAFLYNIDFYSISEHVLAFHSCPILYFLTVTFCLFVFQVDTLSYVCSYLMNSMWLWILSLNTSYVLIAHCCLHNTNKFCNFNFHPIIMINTCTNSHHSLYILQDYPRIKLRYLWVLTAFVSSFLSHPSQPFLSGTCCVR